jgi:hypothetical protein
MPIEKAFAIEASPYDIYAALERDLAGASQHAGETFEVLRRDPGRAIDLRVTIAGVPCWLTYRLEPRDTYTEVIALLTPFGMKYTLFRIMTLGLRDQGFEVALVEGLANLKAAVESERGDADDDDAVPLTRDDEPQVASEE